MAPAARNRNLRSLSTGYALDDFDRLKTITHADATTEQFLYDPSESRSRRMSRAIAGCIALAVLVTCASLTQMTLEREQITSFAVKASLDTRPQTLEVSGLAMHSSLAVSGHRVEREGDALVLFVSLVRATPDLRGDFDIVIEIPGDVNRVLFGERRAEIWRR